MSGVNSSCGAYGNVGDQLVLHAMDGTGPEAERKLFWSIFVQTVSVLVRNSAGSCSGEILVDRSARPRVVGNRSPEWQSWFFTALGVLCFSFTFPMTRLSLRTFDPILIALVRGAGAGVAALIYLMLSRSRIPEPVAIGASEFCGGRDGGAFSDPCLDCTAICSCDTCVGAWIDSATGDRCVWSGSRARIGFARVLDICDFRDMPDRSVFGVSIGLSFDRKGGCVVSGGVYRLFLRVRRRRVCSLVRWGDGW